MIKTAKELAAACVEVATKHKTLYVLGAFGWPMNDANKARAIDGQDYNRESDRKAKINAATAETFGFDCVCMIKALLWGWNADTSRAYGGAVYNSNDVPDKNAGQMMELCGDVSTDFSKIQVGEAVGMEGHIGIYIGDGLAVECTPRWKDGVQITAVHNIGKKAGYNGRSWEKHGKLPFVTYEAEEPAAKTFELTMRQLRKGMKGDDVKALQQLLAANGYQCGAFGANRDGADGDFGANTEGMLIHYQCDHALKGDGIAGPATMASLLGVK